MKHIIHIHQQKLRNGEPAVIDRTYKGSEHGRDLSIDCPKCGCQAAVVKQPEKPLDCGARAYIEASATHRLTK